MLKVTQYFKPFTLNVIWIVLFMFGQAMAELYLPTLMSDVVNKGMVTGDTAQILRYGVVMLATALMSAAFSVGGQYFSVMTSIGVGKNLRDDIFERVESFSMREFEKFGVASLITRTTNDIIQVQTTLQMMFRFLLYSPILCIGGVIMAISKDKGLTVIIGVAIPVLIIMMIIVGNITIPLFRLMQKKIDGLSLVMREQLTGVRVIRAFNKSEYEFERFDSNNRSLFDIAVRINRIMAVMQPIMMIVLNVTTLSIIWFGGKAIDAGQTDLGNMMAFLQYAMLILFSFIMISMMFVMIPRASASAERIFAVLETETSISDKPFAIEPFDAKGAVAFEDVTFRYEGGENAAVSGISFTASPGETTAIIGGTGSGKSTILNLIPRFYDVESGAVRVDGVDVRDLKQASLRDLIGYVPQRAILFSDTVSGNIRYGKPDATFDEVKEAARIAQADNFVSKMELGYETHIAQGGTNVSGGQRQRLSIARAIVKNPLIYLFDDSFSALDFKTDATLRAELKKITSDKTLIIVAQRISSIMDADKIIVLDDGAIAGCGTHRELLKNCEVYKEIAMSQLSEEELANE